jgi:endoglycosylceramidase
MRRWSLALIMALWALIPALVSAGLGLRTAGDRFVDEAGREVLLRGVNAGGRSKLPPFYPFEAQPNFEAGLDRYADGIAGMGFNVVRLLVIWEAAEPAPGRYDQEYLKKYDAMVAAFTRRGVRVIVDSHQDVMSRRFCGDGVPDWVLRPQDRERPQRSDCKMWNVHYFGAATLNNLDRFYANEDGLQDSYALFFKMLAERYRNEPGVIGFEPMNEPMPGGRGLLQYRQWYGQLFGLYEKVAAEVQAVDRRYLIFADLCPLENQGAWTATRPRPKIANLVLAPHYYDGGTFGLKFSRGGDQWFMRIGLRHDLELARAWKVPTLLTEYGITPLNRSAVAYIGELYAVMDEGLISGTFWEASMSATIWNHENTSVFEPDGSLRPRSAALDRPYPRAVAGSIETIKYQPGAGELELTWSEDPQLGQPTVVYLPPRVYGRSPRIELTPPGASSLDPARGELSIPAAGAGERRLVARP